MATTRSEEFYFTFKNIEYLCFPAWQENGGDIFDIVVRSSDEFAGSMFVSPAEEVREAFNRWAKAHFPG